MKTFYLNEHIKHVYGAHNDALYNLKDGSVYSLTGVARDVIRSLDVYNDNNIRDNLVFLNKLESMGLVIFSEKKIPPIEIEKKPIKLRQMWLALNNNCNLQCSHCYAESEPKPSDFSLSNQTIFNAVSDAIKYYGLEFVQFIGGEPLLIDIQRLKTIIQGIKQRGIKEIEIYTNAIPITNKHIELFKEFDVSIAVSIYSHRAQEHDLITNYQGSWNKTTSNVTKLLENNINVRFGVVIMTPNSHIADKIQPWLYERFGEEIKVGVDVMRTCGRGNNTTMVPWQKFQERHIRKNNNDFLPATYETLQTTLYNNVCWGGVVCIHPNGDVSPCEMEFRTIQGNINHQGLYEIISSTENSAQRLSKDSIETCQQCEYRYVCWECRAMANALNKDKNKKPNTCMYNPLNGTWKMLPSKEKFFNP